MSTKGIDRVVYSVGDMEKALGFYRDMIGMREVSERSLGALEISRLWKLSPTTRARAVCLKSELQDTLVELVEFSPNSGEPIRYGPEDLSWGIYDIAWFVKDIQHCY
ncbi:MAG: VOC family protein, partial [Dehalococcoidia bacterium]|nr:VOC family protein [Dehalococcoidia bacterium]